MRACAKSLSEQEEAWGSVASISRSERSVASISRSAGLQAYATQVKMPRVIAWFRNDLRVLDNLALHRAISRAGVGGEVWPVFCLDAARLRPNARAEPDGAKEMDAHRVRFLLQTLGNLRKRLQALGSDLLVVQASAREALPAIIASSQSTGDLQNLVVTQDEPAWPETEAQMQVAAALEQASLGELELVWGTTCFHREDLPFARDLSNLPDSRGSFGVLAERAAHVRFPLPAPDPGSLGEWSDMTKIAEALAARGLQVGLPDEGTVLGVAAAAASSEPLAVMDFVGGEDAGLARVEDYVWHNDENLQVLHACTYACM